MSRETAVLILFSIIFSLSMASCAQGLSENQGILSVRSYQKEQRQLLKIVPRRTEKEILDLTLKQAISREKQSIRQDDFIHTGDSKYPAKLEELRWERTRNIINRVRPGVDENPEYLADLARQAASIEMVLREEHISPPNPKAAALLDRILLFTVPDVHLRAASGTQGDFSLVFLSDGLISFVFQAAKSVVLSWRQIKTNPGSSFSFNVAPEDVEYVLSRNPYPQELLYNSLYEWLINGSSRAIDFDPPPEAYIGLWELLKTHSERFVIAHEYGHILFRKMPSANEVSYDNKDWAEEYGADTFGFIVDIQSGSILDEIPPNISLQGAIFVLSAHNIIRKALDMIRCGVVRKDEGSDKHPPLQHRIENLKRLYREQIGGGKYNIPIEGKLGQSKTIDLGIEGALKASNTLNLLWDRIQDRFLELNQKVNRQEIKLHPIWGEHSCQKDLSFNRPDPTEQSRGDVNKWSRVFAFDPTPRL